MILKVILEDDLVNTVKLQDRVKINGIYKAVLTNYCESKKIIKMFFFATDVQIFNNIKREEFDIGDIAKILQLSKRKDIYDILARSFAPEISGYQSIKKSLILQLIGGNETNFEEENKIKGNINILILSNNSIIKSILLKSILNIDKNAIKISGIGDKNINLAYNIFLDKELGQKFLESGIITRAEKSIVCIDDFDKMKKSISNIIEEVLKEQKIKINEKGFQEVLNAKCSILAGSDYDFTKKYNKIFDSFLPYFDLCFTIIDDKNLSLDKIIADKVINICNTEEENEDKEKPDENSIILANDFLRKLY